MRRARPAYRLQSSSVPGDCESGTRIPRSDVQTEQLMFRSAVPLIVLRALALRGNTMKHLLAGIALVIGLIGLAGPSAAKVVKFEILRTESPAFEGRAFGTVGTYDRIVARATTAVAPGDPHNSIIVDIDRSPRNE